MTRTVQLGPVSLCTQSFGSPGDPAILLMAGSGSSMDAWEEPFCRGLAEGGRFVVRYDYRDTGRSTSWPAGHPGYGGAELIEDVVGLLDAYGTGRACLVGISMGGALAQVVALEHPDRVRGLALISTTAGGDDLPGPAPRLGRVFDDSGVDFGDRESQLAHLVRLGEALAAQSVPYDAAGARRHWEHVLDRTTDPAAASGNHHLMAQVPGWRDRLGGITVPTLVAHGEEDPLFPPEHGAALAAAIPGATLHLMPGVGHELPPRCWPALLPALLAVSL